MPARLTTASYTAIDQDWEKGEQESFLSESAPSEGEPLPKQRIPISRCLVLFPWLLSALLGTVSLALLWQRDLQDGTSRLGSYESGFETDLVTGTSIPLERIRFRGSPHFLPNGTAYLDGPDENAQWPENMRLFGPPSPEIDENWDQLIGGRYISISEEEAIRAWGDRRHEYVDHRLGGYSAGLDVFHTLHCVNALRKMLHPEYYHEKHIHGPFHADHCLDTIRQSIQCYGSTTLIPTTFREGLRRQYIDSDQEHTCRSFRFLRDFTTSRKKGYAGYVERDRSLRDERKHRVADEWRAKHHHAGGQR